ncbi:hypothetical protein [bacterium endosymbiont of Bathymodiolus sp. 5 South]|jgi:hypothetical protein|uniref:hypothetical protein n=1 Tax=bacterium endosymbiont of Bathymodiolus sp. 5 South TaxID=1181670 RepID=UPI0010B187B7|nr:hypothetical protein [bacterium endosymbiont of Bathymodiolus sp. 5 South]CAC9650171.1 hypothetical protein [uncultured Gammaproteobacteria bacterium]SHN90613.1 hypothetical protein BCLUESOX_738 [bacterium endosymbiont of Bathymodiolus sp. 5 South]SSC08350.1 hypothetical protein BTURTLESOX_1190 [bacterium endosymbiont of Bathymodiolus sp. 5 South]VVH55271.1 hypothetical protein BSPCLSOX_2023 [uncultured Gammaproteobacteria bacterium]VVH63620.1 hypothetical protein BSPWISOX_735 [uncultured G
MRFLLLLLFSSSVLALKPHIATYTLSASDFKIGKEVRTLHKEKNVYYYTAHAETTGLASLIKNYEIRAKSTFIIDKFGLRSKHYRNFERDGDKIKKDFNIRPTGRQVDSLNRLLAITHELENNPKKKDFELLVHDGNAPEKQYYQQLPSGDNNLIKVISKERNLTAFFAKDKYYLPVLVHRNKFTYKLDTLEFN